MMDEIPMVRFEMPPARPLEQATLSASPPAARRPLEEPAYWRMARDMIRINEGVKNEVYLDSKDLPTVGVGHLLDKKSLPKYAGRILSADEIEELFDKDLTAKFTASP